MKPRPSTFIRIPKERIGVLIGPEGRVKKYIQQKLTVKLLIESESGGVTAELTEDAKDPSMIFKAKDVVKAIGRGFSPEHAFRIIRDDETIFEMIDLREIFGRSESDIKRVKGRIIGMNGKTRRIIEEITEANVAIYGHTIGIVGNFSQVDIARMAIQMLIDGSQHNKVYRFLQRKRHELKKQKMELWKKQPESANRNDLS